MSWCGGVMSGYFGIVPERIASLYTFNVQSCKIIECKTCLGVLQKEYAVILTMSVR